MKRLILAALVVGILVGADKPKKDDKKGATALEGTWIIVSCTEDGKERDGTQGYKIVFKGKGYVLPAAAGPGREGTFKIDRKKKTIDMTFSETKVTLRGIYALKGDDLKICMARSEKDRATDFTAEKGSGRTLVVLKRAKAE
jgi:uncharacterized protein (TIGR03067 family)